MQPLPRAFRTWRFEPLEPRLLLRFTEVSGESLGLPGDLPNWAESVTWADYNNDGWVDAYSRDGLKQNNGGTFSHVPGVPGPQSDSFWGDFTNDGWMDIYFDKAGADPTFVINREGTGKFDSFTLPGFDFNRSFGSALGDYNGDGWLDVYTGGTETFPPERPQYTIHPDRLLLSRPDPSKPGGRTFEMTWEQSTLLVGRGVTAADFNEDNQLDVYVSNYRLQGNLLWVNNGSGSDFPFTFGSDTYNALGGYGHSQGSAFGDLDSDGHIDLFAGNFAHGGQPESRILLNQGPSGNYHFSDLGQRGVYYKESWSSPALGDFDNDGMLDLFFTALASYGDNSSLFRNTGSPGNPQFSEVGEGIPGNLGGYKVSWADWDNDGDLDLATDGRYFRNDLNNGNSWLKVALRAPGVEGVNGAAIGAIARVTVGNLTVTRHVETGTGTGNQNDMTMHFGLGSHTGPVDVEITWPDGTTKTVQTEANQFITIVMRPDVPNNTPTTPDELAVARVLHDQATVSWNPSTDVEGDPISYEVQYQLDDQASGWSETISTTNTRLALSGLDSNASYRVRVRADDGSSRSAWNLHTNLFTTDPPPFATGFIGEVGVVSDLTDQAQTIFLQQPYAQPVVFAQSPSSVGLQPVTVRVTDVQADHFTIYLQEPSNLDDTHIEETVSYMVLEAGTWQLSGGQMLEVGTVETSATAGDQVNDSRFETVTFATLFPDTPVILSQVQTANDTALVKTRQDGTTASGFQLALDGEEVVTVPHGQETIGYLAIESGSGTWGGMAFEAWTTEALFDNTTRALGFRQNFGQAPNFLSSLASYLGVNPAALRYDHLTGSGVYLTVEEDTTADSEVTHTREVVSYLAINGSGLLSGAQLVGTVLGETGTIMDLTHQPRTILLNSSYDNPVVLAQSPSRNGREAVLVRVTNVQSDRFTIYLQEPSDRDGIHGQETVSYLVLEAGNWQLSDGTRVEVGTLTTGATVGPQLTDQWETVLLNTPVGSSPVLLSQVQTTNDASFVKTRQRNITPGDFQIALEGEEDDTSAHGTETIGYLAIESGSGRLGLVQYEAVTTDALFDDTGVILTFNKGFEGLPDGFLSSLSSFNGANPASLRYDPLSIFWDGSTLPTAEGYSESGTSCFTANQDENGAHPGVTLFDSPDGGCAMNLDNADVELVRANGWITEFRVKTLENTGDRFGHFFAVEDDVGGLEILLNPNSLELYRGDAINYHAGIPELSGPQTFTPGFHMVRIEMVAGGTHFDVSLDGSPLGAILADAQFQGPQLAFGDGSSQSAGRGVWDYVVVAPGSSIEPAVRVYVEEDTTFDAEVVHTFESISYFAFDVQGMLSGVPQTGDVIGETGRITNLTDQSQVIQLRRNYFNPVVIAQSPSYNGFDVATVRVSDVQSDQFTVVLQEPSNLNGSHQIVETVSYLVVEAGRWMLENGASLEAGTFPTNATVGRQLSNPQWATLSFEESFSTAPVVLSQVQTSNDASVVKTRQQNQSGSSIEIALEGEEVASTPHGTETIGYFAIEAGSGVWSGMRFEAVTTGEVVDHIGRTVIFTQRFDDAPELLVSISSYSGANTVGLRYATLTDRGVKLFAEEDTTLDAEVLHGPESVAYFAIGGAGFLTAVVPSDPPQVTGVIRNDDDDNYDVLDTLAFSFDQDVNLAADALRLVNDAAGGAPVGLSGIGFDYDAASRTATWDFSGVIGPTAAWYTATLESNQVTGITGIVLDGERDGVAGGDYAHTFLIAKRGDTDLDGRIDIEDFNTLVMNFDPSGLNSGNNWSKANFDRDSDVDISDFNQLVSNFSPTGYALGAVAMTGANKSPATTAAESVANKTVSDRSPTDKYARSHIAASVEVAYERAFADWGDFGGCGLLLDDVIAARRSRDPNQELADWMRR